MIGIGQITGGAARMKSPRTILGFLAIVFGTITVGTGVAMHALSTQPALHGMLTGIVAFWAATAVALTASVLFMANFRPEALMLGEITGEVFLKLKQLELGDDVSGEFSEQVLVEEPAETTLVAASPKGQS